MLRNSMGTKFQLLTVCLKCKCWTSLVVQWLRIHLPATLACDGHTLSVECVCVCVCACAHVCALSYSVMLTFWNPMDCSRPGSSFHGDSPGKNTGMGCHVLLQGLFLTQEANKGLLHCRKILNQLSYHGSPLWSVFLSK